MGVTSLVIGLISFFVSLIPLCGYAASIPALTGLILGIVFLVQAKKCEDSTPTSTAVTGVVFNSLALLVLLVYTIFFAVIGGSKDTVKQYLDTIVADSVQVMKDSTKNEIEKELESDSSETSDNPFEMGDANSDDTATDDSDENASATDSGISE